MASNIMAKAWQKSATFSGGSNGDLTLLLGGTSVDCTILHFSVWRFKMSCKYGDGSKPWYLVNPKIAGKWMFIPLKMVSIGIDP